MTKIPLNDIIGQTQKYSAVIKCTAVPVQDYFAVLYRAVTYFNHEEEVVMEMKLKLNGIKDVTELVAAAGKCDFDIDIFYNRVIIDAKSVLGILSMDLNKVLTIRCYGVDEDLKKVLQKFAVEEAAA